MKAEQADGGGHRQLEEVGGADQGGRTGDRVLLPHLAVEPVSQPRVEQHLDQDRHRQQGDNQRLLNDGVALKGEQQHQSEQQGRHRPGLDAGHDAVKMGLSLFQQSLAQQLGDDDRDDDIEHHRGKQGIPRHYDAGDPEQQRHQRREGKHHDEVVHRHLRQGEVGIAVGEAAPDKHHGGAGGRRQQDQARYVTVELIRRQPVGKQHADKEPAEEGHGEGLDQPVDKEGDPNPLEMPLHLMQGAKIDLEQHGDDHHPDQQPHRQVDLGHLHGTDRLEEIRQPLPKPNPHQNAEGDPGGQITFKKADGRHGLGITCCRHHSSRCGAIPHLLLVQNTGL